MEPDSLSRCWAEIDLGALRRNARVARRRAGDAELCAVIKANAYGHGLAQIARALANDASCFGVANLDEAIETRAAVSDKPVLILGPALPTERRPMIERGFIASVSSYEEAAGFDAAAADGVALVNFKIDTGMGRMGCDELYAAEEIKRVASLRHVRLHSFSTHLPVPEEDSEFTSAQLARFATLTDAVRNEVSARPRSHALASGGLVAFPDRPFDMLRAGLVLYGISPIPAHQHLFEPVMSLKSRVVLVRELRAGATISYGRTFTAPRPMRVATISAGYADGFMRSLSNRGASVLIRGRRCAVLGRVTMDLTVVDVSDVADAQLADEVVMIGRQDGEEILASEVAERAGTITWEIFTGIGTRVRRVYC